MVPRTAHKLSEPSSLLCNPPSSCLSCSYFSNPIFLSCVITNGESRRVTIAVRDKCGPNRLPCEDGKCIPVGLFCDGKRDCLGGSDEFVEFCAGRSFAVPNCLSLPAIV